MKIALLSLLAILCSFAGYKAGLTLKLRYLTLKEVAEALTIIEQQITYCSALLSDAFCIGGTLSKYWQSISENLSNGNSPEDSFNLSSPELSKLSLLKSDTDLLKNCISSLGSSSRAEQHENLEYYIQIFRNLEDAAHKDWLSKSKLNTSLGVLSGFALIIFLA